MEKMIDVKISRRKDGEDDGGTTVACLKEEIRNKVYRF
jgi:hypothetical protein